MCICLRYITLLEKIRELDSVYTKKSINQLTINNFYIFLDKDKRWKVHLQIITLFF